MCRTRPSISIDVSSLVNIFGNLIFLNVFQVIVILEGMVEATGMTTQARASYLPNEILWGHRFRNVISMSSSNAYKVNFKEFHNVSEFVGLAWFCTETFYCKLARFQIPTRFWVHFSDCWAASSDELTSFYLKLFHVVLKT